MMIMFLRRRVKQFMLISHGVTYLDKVKLFLLACFYVLPNRITNMNAHTPKTMIEYTKNLRVELDGYIYKLSHPRQIFMISDQYERNIQKWFDLSGDTFLDIGANIGKYSIKLSPHFKQVHSFEPTPETNEILNYNITINGIKNVITHRLAAWNKQEQLIFYVKNNPGGNSASMTENAVDTLAINAIRVDDLYEVFGDRKSVV